jgi:LmbE family N-acetylglucosaminyl deacetylase
MFGLHPGDHALVIAPHPDDETLGPGGTVATLTRHGVIVDVLAIACTSETMHGGISDPQVRVGEFDAACTVLGVRNRLVAWIDTEQARCPSSHVRDLIALIETGQCPSLATTAPALVLLPTAECHHQDHLAVHQAALAAVRPGHRHARPLPRIVAGYDGPEDQAWRASAAARPIVVDTTAVAEVKDKALRCYASQLRKEPHPRSLGSIEALDRAAGAAIGADRAERFALYRMEA